VTARVATFEWHTPPPTSVDEVLALFDDGTAVLVVRSPRDGTAAIGSYGHPVAAEDVVLLTAAGPGPHEFDVLALPPDGPAGALLATADRVASETMATPIAVVTFHAHSPGVSDGGGLRVTLLALATGTQPVEFELDPAASSVQFFAADGQPKSWQDLPDLPTGFMTPDAGGLGGVVRPAVIAPGVFGAIAFEATLAPGATQVAILAAGWLHSALPDTTVPGRFLVRTALAPIPG
jgi:hypothetical protein